MTTRRTFLRTLSGLLLAPAFVRAESLMPVRPLYVPPRAFWTPADDAATGFLKFRIRALDRNGSSEWRDVKFNLSPDDVHSIVHHQSLTIRGLEPGQHYRVGITAPNRTLITGGRAPSELQINLAGMMRT